MAKFAIRALTAKLPLLGERSFSVAAEESGGSHATVVIGRNGSGKSTLLRDITYAFRAIAARDGPMRVQRPHGMVETLTVESNGRVVEINNTDLTVESWAGREPVPSSALPSRLIALSFTPFDRFPVRDDLAILRGRSQPLLDEPFYVYLGFKTEGGRASPRARLLRIVNTLAYRQSEASEDARVARTLSAIGYDAELTIEYAISAPIRRVLQDRRRSISAEAVKTRTRVESSFESSRAALLENLGVADAFQRLSPSEHIDLTVNFTSGRYRAEPPFSRETLQQLVVEQALVVSAVRLKRSEGGQGTDLLELSSGELNLLSGFLGLAAHLVDGSLVLIDEPENSLHPEWQTSYVEQLRAIFAQHSGCHYIIATHSPLIVSETTERPTQVVRLDQDEISPNSEVFGGESADATLVKAFDVVTTGNNYVRQVVLEALTLVEDGRSDELRARLLGRFLRNIRPRMANSDPVAMVVDALVVRIPA